MVCTMLRMVGTTLSVIALVHFAEAQGSDSTAALIIGGFDDKTAEVLYSVEIFGCDIPKFPAFLNEPAFLMAAAYVANDGDDYVLSCGGYSCEGDLCRVVSSCYELRSSVNVWTEGPSLLIPRWAHMIATMFDPATGKSTKLTLGLSSTTEYLDDQEYWTSYLEIPSSWTSLDCLVQHGSNIYHIDVGLVLTKAHLHGFLQVKTDLKDRGMPTVRVIQNKREIQRDLHSLQLFILA